MNVITTKTKTEIARIIDILKEQGQMHIRGISRALGIHPMTVSRIIDGYLYPFIEINEIKEFGLKAKLVKLREEKKEITISDVLKYIELRKRIRINKEQ